MVSSPRESLRELLATAGFTKLPSDWSAIALGDLFSDDRGISVGVMYPGEHDPTGVPLIKAGDLSHNRINPHPDYRISAAVHHEYRRTELMGGEILMTLVGNVGSCAVVPRTMRGWNAARAVAVMRLREPRDATYVRACLQSKQIRHLMDVWSNTTVQQTLNLREIRELPLPWPDAKTRDLITNILGSLDDKIELNRRMNETLEEMARALFKSWFVDFDPVRAKAAGRKPSGMDAETAKLFPSEFEESELGEIPKGWTHVRVSDVCDGLFDGPHATPPEAESGAVFLGIRNFRPTSLDLSNIRHIAESDWPRWTKRVVPQHNDIVFTYEATLGFFALIPPGLRCCLGRRTALVRPRAEESDSHFLFHWFVSRPFQEFLRAHRAPGSTVDRIWLKDFPDYPVLQPPSALVSRFEKSVASLWGRIHASQGESQTLAQLRDTLLPKLLSGELSVKSAERILEATA
ncbi:MAG: restriction endonuclease subunit S [Polyangiaceae bacterium]|nr:restriction endonuclease subunit S [Polyangiaceae bacterium]MCB9606558.1 restriction endonuclease subunit S [Polyangiaceae bacterium]